MKFAFEVYQRVNVPNSNGVQGMVTSASAAAGSENKYVVTALTDEAQFGAVGYGEGVLLAANPPKSAAKK